MSSQVRPSNTWRKCVESFLGPPSYFSHYLSFNRDSRTLHNYFTNLAIKYPVKNSNFFIRGKYTSNPLTGKVEIEKLGKPIKFKDIIYCPIYIQQIKSNEILSEILGGWEGRRRKTEFYIIYSATESTILKRMCYLRWSHYKFYQEGLTLNGPPEVDTNKTKYFFPDTLG